MTNNYIYQLKAILSSELISQQELAHRLGVTFAALNRWVNGHVVPRSNKIAQIEQLYKQRVQYPSIKKEDILQIIIKAKQFKTKNIWNAIKNNQNLQDDLILEHTYNSTTIEGTTFTKKQSEIVIFDKVIIKHKSLIEHVDVINYASILRKIFNGEFVSKITVDQIKDFHRLLMQGVRDDGGKYSQHQRGIRGVDMFLTHPKDIPEEMDRLIYQWNGLKKRNIQSIADFHSDFELIHPFGDGNGRVGRLIMALQCRMLNYAPAIIEKDKKAEYYEVLEYSQKENGFAFVQFLAEEMERTLKLIGKYAI